MILKKWLLFFFIATLAACSNPSYTTPENGLDAGRQFTDAIFKGNFKRANDLIVPTEENKTLLDNKIEQPYHQLPNADRDRLSQASIQIINITNSSQDSSTVINFVNAYDGKPANLKVIKYQGNWLVDLKSMFTTGGK
jgi:hypothetical protein